MSANTSLTDALTSLMASEAEYVEKLSAVREVIAGLRKVLGVSAAPSSPDAAPARHRRGSRSAPAVERDVPPDVHRALQDGPLLAAEFLKKTKLSPYRANKLVKQGVIVATGVTNSRRYALPAAAGKEAP